MQASTIILMQKIDKTCMEAADWRLDLRVGPFKEILIFGPVPKSRVLVDRLNQWPIRKRRPNWH